MNSQSNSNPSEAQSETENRESGGLRKQTEEYLLKKIPLSRYMQIRVEECSAQKTVLVAPLTPNVNDKGIAFGGSLAVMAKLAAWAKFYEHHERTKLQGELLVAKAETRFLKPARGELKAICESPVEEEWQKFEEALEKKGRARLTLKSRVESEGVVALEMSAQFASVRGFR